MKRFLIFPALFPPLALVMFTAPDGFKNLLDWMVMAIRDRDYPGLAVGLGRLGTFRKATPSYGNGGHGSTSCSLDCALHVGRVRRVMASPDGWACRRSSGRGVFVAVR